MKKGLLLIQLGTPEAPCILPVARYLSRFLRDPKVIDAPFLQRMLLVYGIILPFRTLNTTRAYRQIWTEQGSPLRVHAQALLSALQQSDLSHRYDIQLAMRYGHPSIKAALNALAHCQEIVVLPLYPQYASASTGSSLAHVLKLVEQGKHRPAIHIIPRFYDHPAYIQTLANHIKPFLAQHDFLLLSYHGLPERQVKKSGCATLCHHACPTTTHQDCYRAQCYRTSALLAEALSLVKTFFNTSFQSRVGLLPWIQPDTASILSQLRQQGIKRLLMVCPSFTVDCLETLEEIGLRAKAQWLDLGGEAFTLVPSLNAETAWVKAIAQLIPQTTTPR